MIAFFKDLYPPSPSSTRDGGGHIGWFLTTFALVLAVTATAAVVIALSGIVLSWPPGSSFSTSSPNVLTFLGLSLLVGAAGFAAGGFLGFLFGVPRVRTSEGAAAVRSSPDEVVSNTNLEQVSDWLTKIVVGITLVQFHQVNDLLVAFRDQIDLSMRAAEGTRAGGIPGAGFSECLILIGASIAGFLAAYLKSKTDLMFAFRAPMERVQSAIGKVVQSVLITAAKAVLDRPSLEPDVGVKDAATKLLQAAPEHTDDPEMLQLVGLAYAVLKNFPASAAALSCAVSMQTKAGQVDPELKALTARALALSGDTDQAKTLSEPPPAVGPYTPEQIESALAYMFGQLYARGGYDEAIRTGELLGADPEARKSGRLRLYQAAALGQKHAALIRSQAAPDLIAQVTQEALAAVKEAVRLDSGHNLQVLCSLWDPHYPGKSPSENDLETFFGDEDFAAVLKPGIR